MKHILHQININQHQHLNYKLKLADNYLLRMYLHFQTQTYQRRGSKVDLFKTAIKHEAERRIYIERYQ